MSKQMSGCLLHVNSKKYIWLPATVVEPVMLDFIQLALFGMPPTEAATGQRGGGGGGGEM